MGRLIAFVPVRGGSKSIPLKNIKPLLGRPLVCWTLDALEECAEVDQIILATDSVEIQQVVQAQGYRKVAVYERDPLNAQDTSSTESVMLEYLGKTQVNAEDWFMLVQATSPFTTAQHFSEAFASLQKSGKDSLLTAVKTKRFFWTEEGKGVNYDYRNRPRRQDFPGYMMENGAFYINRVGAVLADRNRLSGDIQVYEMPEHTGLEIDEPDDWILAEALLRKHRVKPATKIRLVLSDVDGVLTDGSMYYSENGDELKRFHTYDGVAFRLMQERGLKTGIITSEKTSLVERRAKKMKLDFIYQDSFGVGKLQACLEICKQLEISISQVAYVGDDLNCKELLQAVGIAFCPANARAEIRAIPGIISLASQGGSGCLRNVEEYLRGHNA